MKATSKNFRRKALRSLQWQLCALLLTTAGYTQTPYMVKDICTGTCNGMSSGWKGIELNEMLYFPASDGTNGAELWQSDGTDAGTLLIKDINTGSPSSNISSFLKFNTQFVFVADDGINGKELWISDGTSLGTNMVKDIWPGIAASNPSQLIVVNGNLFFVANDGTNGEELWKSDGTASGTMLIKDIFSGSGSSNISSVYNFNNTLIFIPDDVINGREIWTSDGTPGGTVILKDINPGTSDCLCADFITSNNTLFFTANDGINGIELWKSDGTYPGTMLVKDVDAGSGSARFEHFINYNGYLFLGRNDNGSIPSIVELWKTDGTTAGTTVVKSFTNPSVSNQFLLDLDTLNDKIIFWLAADTLDLWVSDGTSAGTVIIKKGFWPSSVVITSDSRILFNAGNSIFMGGADLAGGGVYGAELWETDGTSIGTEMVKDINPGNGSSIYYGVNSPLIKGISVNSDLYFVATNGNNGNELWKSDGTDAGTIMLKDIYPGINGGVSSYTSFFQAGSNLFFDANDGSTGTELWTFSTPTSIDDETKSEIIRLQVMPNPVSEQVIINYYLPKPSGVSIEVFDMLGKKINTLLVQHPVQGNNTYKLDAVNLIPGLYLVKMTLDNKEIYTSRFVKMD